MRICVVGASGFLGHNLLKYFREIPTVSANGVSRKPSPLVTTQVRDYSRETLENLVSEAGPDLIINCAGLVGHKQVADNPEEAAYVNVDLPAMLASLSQKSGAHFIQFSSDSVYSGVPAESPFNEESATAPFSLYGLQKLECEQAVLGQNADATILRVNFFGWSLNGRTGILDHFVRKLLSGENPIGYENYVVSSIYSGDLGPLISRISTLRLSGIFNAGASDSMSKHAFGVLVAKSLGLDSTRIIPGTPSLWEELGVENRDLSMSVSKLEEGTGITAPPTEESLRHAFNDLRKFLEASGVSDSDPRAQIRVGGDLV